jgi:hypothetical protein
VEVQIERLEDRLASDGSDLEGKRWPYLGLSSMGIDAGIAFRDT